MAHEKKAKQYLDWRVHVLILTLCAVALTVRLQLDGIVVSPDGRLYIRLAENLVKNFCFSESDPSTAECIPSWGGQPPGYPIFIAIVGLLFGFSPNCIIVGQIFIFGIALWYALFIVAKLNINIFFLVLSGLAVSLSPATVGFSRWVITETLSSAACLWLVAECLNSIAIRRVSIIRFSIAIGTCALLRWDMIWVAIPFVLVAYHVCGPRQALQKTVLVAGFSGIPYLALIARAALVGLTVVPPATRGTSEEVPPGILSFWKAAAVSQVATKSLLWHVWGRRYSTILEDYDPDSFLKIRDPYNVDDLIKNLALLSDGEAVPQQVDSTFNDAARAMFMEDKALHLAKLLSLRAYHMWIDKDVVFRFGYGNKSMQAGYFGRIAEFERLFSMLALVYCSIFLQSRSARLLATGLCFLALSRTMFLASLTALEIRYLSPILPSMGFAAILLWGLDFQSRVQPGSRAAP